ncbi:MAG: tyrosine-protein phosphatase [bacterium]|jgi:protein-tyrosine phosphatase
MVDLHSHVLPGLDDGARSLEQAIQMVQIAAAAGTTDLVASPHCNPEYSFDPATVEAKLQELARASGGAVRLHYGCDFHFYFENIEEALRHPSRYTIAHKRYLLVEFPDILIMPATDEIFDRFLQAGIVPIVTHPERNFLLHARLEQIERWVRAGVLMQVTAQSFLGRFGREPRRFARELMLRSLVHIVASDAHDTEDRTPRLDVAFKHVSKTYGPELAQALFVTNPAAVLEGKPLPALPPIRRRRWFAFWASAGV